MDIPPEQWADYYEMHDIRTHTPVHPAENPLFNALNGEQVVNQNFSIKPLNGALKIVSVNAQPLVDQQGKLLGAVSATHDLTQLKQSEEKLKYKIKELDMFIYKASHDLKGPLSSMAGLLNLAKLEFSDPEVLQYLDKLEQSNNKLEIILQGLLEVVHIKQGKTSNGEIRIHSLVQDVINSLRNLPRCEYIRFSIEMDPAETIQNDERILRGILQNLIHNAIKYRREVADSYIRIKGYRKDQHYYLEVYDNGIGIQEGLKEKVFDMFFRGHYTSTGSGLGLYIVKNAVEKLNGKIEVKSEYGKSTAFLLQFPQEWVALLSDPVEKQEGAHKAQ